MQKAVMTQQANSSVQIAIAEMTKLSLLPAVHQLTARSITVQV